MTTPDPPPAMIEADPYWQGDGPPPTLRWYDADQMHAHAVTLAETARVVEREKMLADIRAEIALEGFGCACTPNRSCGTCIARRTLLGALDPLLKSYEAAIRAEQKEQQP